MREKFLIEPLPGPDTVITPAYLISLSFSSSHIASHPAENTTNEDDEREREREGGISGFAKLIIARKCFESVFLRSGEMGLCKLCSS